LQKTRNEVSQHGVRVTWPLGLLRVMEPAELLHPVARQLFGCVDAVRGQHHCYYGIVALIVVVLLLVFLAAAISCGVRMRRLRAQAAHEAAAAHEAVAAAAALARPTSAAAGMSPSQQSFPQDAADHKLTGLPKAHDMHQHALQKNLRDGYDR
jgi:hypothetical protein